MASKSINKVLLLGHVGKDPEVKYTAGGAPLATFSLATNERYKDKSSGEWQDRTEWHQLVAWQRTAEIVGEYVHKGSRLHVEGRLQTSSWEDKQSGDKKYRTEIVVTDLILLGGNEPPNGNGNGADRHNGHSRTQRPAERARQYERQPGEDDERFASAQGGITDDEIPF